MYSIHSLIIIITIIRIYSSIISGSKGSAEPEDCWHNLSDKPTRAYCQLVKKHCKPIFVEKINPSKWFSKIPEDFDDQLGQLLAILY